MSCAARVAVLPVPVVEAGPGRRRGISGSFQRAGRRREQCASARGREDGLRPPAHQSGPPTPLRGRAPAAPSAPSPGQVASCPESKRDEHLVLRDEALERHPLPRSGCTTVYVRGGRAGGDRAFPVAACAHGVAAVQAWPEGVSCAAQWSVPAGGRSSGSGTARTLALSGSAVGRGAEQDVCALGWPRSPPSARRLPRWRTASGTRWRASAARAFGPESVSSRACGVKGHWPIPRPTARVRRARSWT